MSNSVVQSSFLNKSDTVLFNKKSTCFPIFSENTTDQELILIYMYILPKFPTHGIKVGMTKCRINETFWHAIKSRIAIQEHELALTPEQFEKYGFEREVVYWGICLDANSESFKDYKVHDEILKQCAGLVEKDQEWFQNVPTDELIEAFEKCRKNEVSYEIYNPRKEQRECVDALLSYFKDHPNGSRFLLNCKMRYGKSYTTYKYCEEANLNKVLILTFIPAVESSWKEDLTHISKKYNYYTDNNIRNPKFLLKDKNDPYVVFLSLQNYLGRDRNTNETKDKIKKLQEVNWDLVILDEYHFGAWNEKTQGTLESQEDLESEYQEQLKKTKDVLEVFKINTKQTICLSGTPFKAIAKGEFTKENTFTYSYFDEQRNKYPKSKDSDFSEINPEYEHFPDMKIFGYNMSRLFSGMTASVFSGDTLYGKKYFSLNRFFETRRDSNPKEPCVFVYEEQIKKWLDIIKGKSTFGDKFPYSNTDMLMNNKHTLWLLPRVNAVHAMAKLLREDDYFKKYQIINLSEEGVGAGVDAFDYLNEGIVSANNTNKLGSIALTVNKLTTGVTVKEWFSVFVLKDLASPEQYFQSIFRIQTPYKEKGKILKPYGFVYDFNIDRAAALLLKYTEQSEDMSVTKLEIAKLIVKYLPIFVNGDMSEPISASVFYELAEFGDTSGVPLSKKITDTTKTTRMLDDEVMSEMLNDNEVSDILKRVFAHAKFNKPKSNTMTQKPVDDGFQTKTAKAGRDKGYELGMENYEKYVNYDNLEIQEAYEKDIEQYIKDLCPGNLDKEQATWWANGFTRGYDSGVNAPIKKMNCGHDDGVKFCKTIKLTLGDKIVWKEATRKQILDIIHKHLNRTENIPSEYRGALYRRWYCDSFKKAVKNELAPDIPYEKGRSVEDADNVLKHILARLFEFLYISVYRETTFDEIFENADPNIFLEAVGITKKDFEVLNKYRVFQENVLNNYIHQFFVNESIGSKLNLEDDEVRKQYRNSFDWFGFGLEGDVTFSQFVKDRLEEISQNIGKPSEEHQIVEHTELKDLDKYYFAYGSNLNLNQMSIRCPRAQQVGTAMLEDYRLMFKKSSSGYYLTVEKATGHQVPLGIFAVSDDEISKLDVYEGCPAHYYKQKMTVKMTDYEENEVDVEGIIYILPEDREFGLPDDLYVKKVKDGYDNFFFNKRLIDEAIEFTKQNMSVEISDDDLVEKIKDVLSGGKIMHSKKIADILSMSKQTINKTLYSHKDIFYCDMFFNWRLK